MQTSIINARLPIRRWGKLILVLLPVIIVLMLRSAETLFPKKPAQMVQSNALSEMVLPSDAVVMSGMYTGSVAINEPLALGVQDISLVITETNGTLTGVLNDGQSLAFSQRPILNGIVTARNNISATFHLASSEFVSVISGRQVTRKFVIEGSAHNNGDIVLGVYEEQITGFTPQTLLVYGMFMASRPIPVASASTGTTSASHRIYLPNVSR